MKKNVIKTVIAAVCVVAAGMGGMKAYNTANQSEADMLLAENVEALSSGDYYGSWPCKSAYWTAMCITSCSGSYCYNFDNTWVPCW